MDRKAPITIKFEIPYFTVSGIQVRYLKIVEKSGYQALREWPCQPSAWPCTYTTPQHGCATSHRPPAPATSCARRRTTSAERDGEPRVS